MARRADDHSACPRGNCWESGETNEPAVLRSANNPIASELLRRTGPLAVSS